jgi:glycine/D-amino acid oxidase-like deaminating enzyme
MASAANTMTGRLETGGAMHAGGAPDVVVVGGGIAGTATAAFLAGAGAHVLLLEREGLASGASGANSGVVQHPFDPVLAALYRETVVLYRDLAAGSRAFAFPASPVGLLSLSESEATVRREAERIRAPYPELGVEVLGGRALRAVEPAVAEGMWACLVDIGYPVAPGASTYAYATLAEARGAVIRMGRTASLEVAGDAVVGVRFGGEVIPAGAVVAAAGPWTPELLDPTGRWAPISPRWGVVVEVEPASPPRHVLEEAEEEDEEVWPGVEIESSFALVPQPGAAAVGATFLAREPDPAAWMERILVRASRFVPGVAEAPIRGVRACARPLSADGRPLVGVVPGKRNLFVCAGHGPWGISTGPASARLVADLAQGRSPSIPTELDPARFGEP